MSIEEELSTSNVKKDHDNNEEENINKDSLYYKLKNSDFKQQKIPCYRPQISNMTIVSIMFILALIFSGLGLIIIFFSSMIEEYSIPYCDNMNILINNDNNYMLYYEFENYYQNHRQYVKGVSENQLKGINLSKNQLINECKGALTNKEIGVTLSINNTPLQENEVAIPCGIYAKSFLNISNLTINFINEKKEKAKLIENNISWDTDREIKFKNSNEKKQWVNITNEHFIVWMKPSGYSNFRKLYGKFENLKRGYYDIEVKCFNKKCDNIHLKNIILSTTNLFGGKNYTLGIFYIFLGIITFVFSILIMIGDKTYKDTVIIYNNTF